MPHRFLALAAVAVLAASVGACGSPQAQSGSNGDVVEVVASFYPLQHAVQQVGGSHVDVTNLTKPGAEPHDVELTPQDVATVSKAELAVYQQGFQPAVDQAIAEQAPDAALDVASAADLSVDFVPAVGGSGGHGGHHGDHADDADHAGEAGHVESPTAAAPSSPPTPSGSGQSSTDPHFWLDPTRYDKVAQSIAARLGEIDPTHRAEYDKNAAAFSGRLTTLDTEFTTGLKQCRSRDLVTSHAAFGYLADRYDLHQIAISGLSPEAEPDPARLAQIADLAKADDIRTIYSETLVSPAVAQTVARETGAASAVLDPIEGLTDTSAARDYVGIMRHNLATLRTGQGCS